MGTLGKKIVVSIILGFVVLGVIVYSQNAFAQSFDLTGLKAYWKFEETSGPLKMDPISEFSTDSIVDVEMTKTFPGIIGNAWKFGTGTTEKPSPTRIEIGNADNWNFHQGHQKPGYTHNFWAKAIDNNVSPRSAVFSNGGLSGTSNNNLFVTFDYSGSHTRIWVIDRAILPKSPFSHVGVDGKLPTDDKWHMFTFTKDLSALGGSGNNFPLRFYVDGVFEQQRKFEGNSPATNYLVLGNQCGSFCIEWDGGAYENTPVDEWSVWSRVLTDSEITDLYNDGIGLELDDLDSDDEGSVVLCDASLDGSQMIGPVVTDATGAALFTLELDSNLLEWNPISFTDLTSEATTIFIHGPAPSGLNAGMQLDAGDISGGVPMAIAGAIMGSTVIDDTQKSDLLNELWYIIVRNSEFPAGVTGHRREAEQVCRARAPRVGGAHAESKTDCGDDNAAPASGCRAGRGLPGRT